MSKTCYTHVSAEERETLSLGLAHGHSLRTMAREWGRAPSTVRRESARNTARGHPYRACTAQTLATARARQPRRPRKLLDPGLWQYVRKHLAQDCLSEQIAGRLRREYPDDMQKPRSAETIYVALYVLPRGTLRSELLAALRQARKASQPRSRGTDRRGQLPNRTLLAERPADVATRTVPGHGEGDLITGRSQWLGRRHPGGADDTPGSPGTDGGKRCGECPPGIHKEAPARARPAAQNPDLRSGQRNGRARAPGGAAQHPSVLCRSVQPVATGHQRDHQWAPATVSAQGHRLVRLYPARAEHHRPSSQYSTENMSQLRHATGGLYATASSFTHCTWNLKPPYVRILVVPDSS